MCDQPCVLRTLGRGDQGWEAFGALGWKTNEKTVTENVERYLESGYPLAWMVVGSGFWPNEDPNLCATTSFGLWDKVRYPDPKRFVERFKSRGLKFFLGLRISFIEDGPYSAEGVAKGYFLKENGQAKAWQLGFPKRPAIRSRERHNIGVAIVISVYDDLIFEQKR